MADGLEEREKKELMLQIHYYIWLLERLIMMIHCSVSRAVQFGAVLQKKIQKVSRQQETEARNATAAVHFFSLKKPTF